MPLLERLKFVAIFASNLDESHDPCGQLVRPVAAEASRARNKTNMTLPSSLRRFMRKRAASCRKDMAYFNILSQLAKTR
ncbi:MAG: hypothetical protein ACLSAP_06935 [Oscillospiraceae bacterium]